MRDDLLAWQGGQRGETEGLTERFAVTGGGSDAALLLEREGVLAELGAAMSRARSGNGRVVFMEGPAGIGKTRLLAEARDRAGGLGLAAHAARGGPLERAYGFGVVRQLLESAIASASPQTRRELLSGAAALAEPVFATEAVTASEDIGPTQSALHGLYWLVANLAERAPLLLTVDDVHWADEPSLRFLLYLARRLEGLPVAVVLALRTGEASTAPELLHALRVEAHPPILEPAALSPAATRTLAAALLGRALPDDLARACQSATRGNPFLLAELLHQLRGAPDDMAAAAVEHMASGRVAAEILLRVARVGASAGALVQATAVLGESADLGLAAALAGLDVATATTLADGLARAEIVEPVVPPQPLRFVHPLVRSAVYEDMPRAGRARLHARAAALLADGRHDGDAAAMHLLLSDPAGDAATVEVLREAAHAAIARGAPETAVEFLSRAEREPPPAEMLPDVLLEHGMAATRAGRPEAVTLLTEAFELAPGQPARARAGLELAFALGVSRSGSTAVIDVLESARDGLHDDDLRTLVDARIVMLCAVLPSVRPRFVARLAEARTALELPPSDALRVLYAPLAPELLFTGAATGEVIALAERALEGGHLMRREVAQESDLALGALAALIVAGELRSARRHVEVGIAHARACGSRFALARLSAYRALILWHLGDLGAAESDAHVALSVDAAWGIPHAVSTAVLAHVQIERGDLDGAQELLAALEPDPAMLDVTPNQIVRETRAALLMAQGRPREALIPLREYARWEERWGAETHLGPVPWRSAAALAHLQLGETDEARALAARETELARRFGAAPQLGGALRALALVEGGTAGVKLLEEAVTVLAASAARLDHARAVIDLGAMLRRCGRRTAATQTLRTGMELAHRCAATALVDAAGAQLRLAGARPRRIAVSGRAALTPSEHRVADLAADGMSNKQIAQGLFVTLRTVEMHLSNTYRKLDIASREELPAALAHG